MNLPLGQNVKVLKVNALGLFALGKPEGILSHPNKKTDTTNCLLNAAYDLKNQFYYWRDAEDRVQKCYLLNRLDSPTSGVILVSTNLKIAQIVKELFKVNKVSKTYHAIVKGVPKIPNGTWRDALIRSKSKGTLRVRPGQGDKAITFYQLESMSKSSPKVSLVELSPKTGKTHQLRVHSAKNGHPILGDKTYGDFNFNRTFQQLKNIKRLYLHASQVELEFQFGKRKVIFSAKSRLPEDFKTLLD